MSSASIAVYRIQAACFVGRGDGKLAQRVREFQQLRGLGMLRDNRVGVKGRRLQYALARVLAQLGDSGKKRAKLDLRFVLRLQESLEVTESRDSQTTLVRRSA